MVSPAERETRSKKEAILAKAPFTRMFLRDWKEEDLPQLQEEYERILLTSAIFPLY